MRAGRDHAIAMELDLRKTLEMNFKTTVPLAEAALNRLNPVMRSDGSQRWPSGFQFYNVCISGMDPRALLLLRDAQGASSFDQVRLARDPDRELIVARDIVPSPFPGEQGHLYATGYNARASADSGFRRRAWVARGDPRPVAGSAPTRREDQPSICHCRGARMDQTRTIPGVTPTSTRRGSGAASASPSAACSSSRPPARRVPTP